MSDGSLSQDEIDALLQGTGGMDFDTGPAATSVEDAEVEAFKSVIKETVTSQQSNLSMLVSINLASSLYSSLITHPLYTR